MAEAAPQPLLGLQNESPLNRIAMQVTQLFHAFLPGKDNEIVEAALGLAHPFIKANEAAPPSANFRGWEAMLSTFEILTLSSSHAV